MSNKLVYTRIFEELLKIGVAIPFVLILILALSQFTILGLVIPYLVLSDIYNFTNMESAIWGTIINGVIFGLFLLTMKISDLVGYDCGNLIYYAVAEMLVFILVLFALS